MKTMFGRFAGSGTGSTDFWHALSASAASSTAVVRINILMPPSRSFPVNAEGTKKPRPDVGARASGRGRGYRSFVLRSSELVAQAEVHATPRQRHHIGQEGRVVPDPLVQQVAAAQIPAQARAGEALAQREVEHLVSRCRILEVRDALLPINAVELERGTQLAKIRLDSRTMPARRNARQVPAIAAELRSHQISEHCGRQPRTQPPGRLKLRAVELRIPLRILDEAEVLELVQGARIGIVVDVVVEAID